MNNEKIMNNEKNTTPQDPEININVQALHKFLISKKVNGIPSDVKSFAEGVKNQNNARNLHGALKRMNVSNIPNSYIDFQHKLGIPTKSLEPIEASDIAINTDSDITIKNQSDSKRKQNRLQRQQENKQSLDELRSEYESLSTDELKSIVDEGVKSQENKTKNPLTKMYTGQSAIDLLSLVGKKDATNADMRRAVANTVYKEKTFKEHYEQSPPDLTSTESIISSYQDYLKKHYPEDPMLEKIEYKKEKNKKDPETEKEFLDQSISMISQIERKKVSDQYTPEVASVIEEIKSIDENIARQESMIKSAEQKLNSINLKEYTPSSINEYYLKLEALFDEYDQSIAKHNELIENQSFKDYSDSVDEYGNKMGSFVKDSLAKFYSDNPDYADKVIKKAAIKEVLAPPDAFHSAGKPIVGSAIRQVDGLISLARYFDGKEKKYSGVDAFSDNFSKTMDYLIDDVFGPDTGDESTFDQVIRMEYEGKEYNAYMDRENNIIDLKQINADYKLGEKTKDAVSARLSKDKSISDFEDTEYSKEIDVTDDELKARIIDKFNNLNEKSIGKLKINVGGLQYNATRTISDMIFLLGGASAYSKAFAVIPGMGANASGFIGLTVSGLVLEHNDLYSHAIDAGMSTADASRFALKTGLTIAAMENISPQKHVFGSLGKRGITDTYIKRLAKGSTIRPGAAVTKHILTEIGEENIQELSQTFAEKIYDYAAFRKFGLEEMMPTIDLEEVMETVMLTSLASGLLAGGTANTVKRNPHMLETEALYHLTNMPNTNLKSRLEKLMLNNTLTKDNANRVIEIVNEARAVKDKIPASITNPAIYGQLLTLITDKSRLENQLKGMDDAILKSEGPAIQEKIDKINKSIEVAASKSKKIFNEKKKTEEAEKIKPIEPEQKEKSTEEKESIKEDKETDEEIKISEITSEDAAEVRDGFRSIDVSKEIEGFNRIKTEDTDIATPLKEEGFYSDKEKGEINAAAPDLSDLAYDYLNGNVSPSDYLKRSNVSATGLSETEVSSKADKLASYFYSKKEDQKISKKKEEVIKKDSELPDIKSTLSSIAKLNKQPIGSRKKASIESVKQSIAKINESIGSERLSVKRNSKTGTVTIIDNNTGKAIRSVPADLSMETKKPVVEKPKQESKPKEVPKEQTVQEKHLEAIAAARKGKVTGKVLKNKKGSGFTFKTKGDRTFNITGTWSKIIDPTLNYEVKIVEKGKEGETIVTSDGTKFKTVKLNNGQLKLTKDGTRFYDEILELHSIPTKGNKSQFIGNIESGSEEGNIANPKDTDKTVIDQYTDNTAPKTKETAKDNAAKSLQHLKNAWNISKKPGDLNSSIIGLPSEAIKELLLAAKEIIIAGAKSVAEIQRKLKNQVFSMDITVEDKTVMFNMIDRHIDEFETLLEEMELMMKFPNNNIAESPEKLKAIRSSLSTVFKSMEKLGVKDAERKIYDISKTNPLRAKNKDDYKKWQEEVKKSYDDGALIFEAFEIYNIDFDKVISIMNFYENVKVYKHVMLTYDGDGGYSVIDMNNKMEVTNLVKSIRNTLRNYVSKDSNGKIIKNRNAALKQDYKEYRLKRDKALSNKAQFDLDVEFLSKITGIDERLWRLYFSPQTNETVVYRQVKSKDGKISFKKEIYESAEDLFAKNNNNFPEDMYYQPKSGKQMKRFSIIGAMGKEFDTSLRSNESKFVDTAIKFFIEKSSDKAWPNAAKLAGLKSTQYEFDFMTPDGKRGVSLIQSSNLSIAAEEVRDQNLPNNDVVKYYKEVGEGIELIYSSGAKNMSQGSNKASKAGSLTIKDMIITQAMMFLDSFIDTKENDVYYQSIGQFGDKKAFAFARVKKVEIDEKRLELIKAKLGEGVFESIVKSYYNAIFKGKSKLPQNKELNDYNKQMEFARQLVYNFIINKANLDQIFFGTAIGTKSNYKNTTDMYKRAGSTNSSGYRLNEHVSGGVGERQGTEKHTEGRAAYRHVVVNEKLLETLGVKNFESFDGLTLISDKFASRVQVSMGILFSKADVFEKLVTLKALHSSTRNNIRGLTKSNMVNSGVMSSVIKGNDSAYHKLNQFMIDNDIDMLSFESGTKKVEHKITKEGKTSPAIYPIFNNETGEFDTSIDPKEYIYERRASDLIVQQDLRSDMALKFAKQPIQFIASTLKLKSADNVAKRWNRIQGLIVRDYISKYNALKNDIATVNINGKEIKINIGENSGLDNAEEGQAIVKTYNGKTYLTFKGTNIRAEANSLSKLIGQEVPFTIKTSLEQKRDWIRNKINYRNDPDLYSLVENGADLDSPVIAGGIRLKIVSQINNDILERKIRRVQAQEVPGVDIPLQGHAITSWLNKMTGKMQDQVILGHVLLDMDGIRYSEEYDSFDEAVGILSQRSGGQVIAKPSGITKYPDMYDSDGNVKEWEIYKENGKWYIPGEPVVITRIPSDDLHSHQILRAKYRIEGAGNIIITDRGSQMISGSDNDGDMRYIEVVNKDSEGNPDMNPKSVNGPLNANIYDVLEDYQNPDNFDMIMRPIDTNAFNDIHSKYSQDRKSYEPYDPMGYFDSYEKNMVGNRLKGIMTNITVIFSFMSKHDVKLKKAFSLVMNGNKYSFRRVNPDENNIVKAYIGNLLNMAYDNAKDPKLEEMFINEHTANLVAGLLITNEELIQKETAAEQNEFILEFVGDLVAWMKDNHVDKFTEIKRGRNDVSFSGSNAIDTGSKEVDNKIKNISREVFKFNDIVTISDFKDLGQRIPLNAAEMIEAISSFMAVRDNSLNAFDTSSLFNDEGDPVDDLKMSSVGIATAMEVAFKDSLEFSNPGMEVMSRVYSYLSTVYKSLPTDQKITGKNYIMSTSDYTSIIQLLQRIVAMRGFGIKSSFKSVEKKITDRINELTSDENYSNDFLDYIQQYESGKNKGAIGILNSFKFAELSSYEKDVAKRAFAELPEDLKELLSYYSIARYGIGTGRIAGNYFELIDEESVINITKRTGEEARKWINNNVSERDINLVAISIIRGNPEWNKTLPEGTRLDKIDSKSTPDFNMVPFVRTEVSFDDLENAAHVTNASELRAMTGNNNFDYLIDIYRKRKLKGEDITWKEFISEVSGFVEKKIESNSITNVIDNFIEKIQKFKPSNYLRNGDDPLTFSLDPVQAMLEITINIIENNARRFQKLSDHILNSLAKARARIEYKKLTAGEKAVYESLVNNHILATYNTIPNNINLIDLLTPEEKRNALKNGENPIQKGIEIFFAEKLRIFLGKSDLSTVTMQEQALITKKGEYGLDMLIYDLMTKGEEISEEQSENIRTRIRSMTLYQKLHLKAYGIIPSRTNNESYRFLKTKVDGKLKNNYDLTDANISMMVGVPLTISAFASNAGFSDINSVNTINEYKRYLKAYIRMSEVLSEVSSMREIGDGISVDSKKASFEIQKYSEALNAIDAYGAVKILTNYLEEIMLEQRTNELIKRENKQGYSGSRIMTQILGILTNPSSSHTLLTGDFKLNSFERKISKYIIHRKDFSHNEPLLQAYARDFYEMYNNNVFETLESRDMMREFRSYFENNDKEWFESITEKTAFGREFISPGEAKNDFGEESMEYKFIKFVYKASLTGNPTFALRRNLDPEHRLPVPTRFVSKIDMMKKFSSLYGPTLANKVYNKLKPGKYDNIVIDMVTEKTLGDIKKNFGRNLLFDPKLRHSLWGLETPTIRRNVSEELGLLQNYINRAERLYKEGNDALGNPINKKESDELPKSVSIKGSVKISKVAQDPDFWNVLDQNISSLIAAKWNYKTLTMARYVAHMYSDANNKASEFLMEDITSKLYNKNLDKDIEGLWQGGNFLMDAAALRWLGLSVKGATANLTAGIAADFIHYPIEMMKGAGRLFGEVHIAKTDEDKKIAVFNNMKKLSNLLGYLHIATIVEEALSGGLKKYENKLRQGAFVLIEVVEVINQGLIIAGSMTKEEWDSLDNEGKPIAGKTPISENRKNVLKIKAQNVHGAYGIDKAGYNSYMVGRLIGFLRFPWMYRAFVNLWGGENTDFTGQYTVGIVQGMISQGLVNYYNLLSSEKRKTVSENAYKGLKFKSFTSTNSNITSSLINNLNKRPYIYELMAHSNGEKISNADLPKEMRKAKWKMVRGAGIYMLILLMLGKINRDEEEMMRNAMSAAVLTDDERKRLRKLKRRRDYLERSMQDIIIPMDIDQMLDNTERLIGPLQFANLIGKLFADAWRAVMPFADKEKARYQKSTQFAPAGELKVWNDILNIIPIVGSPALWIREKYREVTNKIVKEQLQREMMLNYWDTMTDLIIEQSNATGELWNPADMKKNIIKFEKDHAPIILEIAFQKMTESYDRQISGLDNLMNKAHEQSYRNMLLDASEEIVIERAWNKTKRKNEDKFEMMYEIKDALNELRISTNIFKNDADKEVAKWLEENTK